MVRSKMVPDLSTAPLNSAKSPSYPLHPHNTLGRVIPVYPMTELPTDGQLRGPSFLRLMGIRLPSDDTRPVSGSPRRSNNAPVLENLPVSIPSITLGERALLPAATIYTLRSVPTSSRYRLSIDAEECVAEHEARLSSNRNGSKTSLISHQASVKALKSPAPSPEANVQHATRAFVSKAQAVAPFAGGDHEPSVPKSLVAKGGLTFNIAMSKGASTDSSHQDTPVTVDNLPAGAAKTAGLAVTARAQPLRRLSRKAIPAVEENSDHSVPLQVEGDKSNALDAKRQKSISDVPVADSLAKTAVLVPRSSSRKVRPKSKFEVNKTASDKALPVPPLDPTLCTSDVIGGPTAPTTNSQACLQSDHAADISTASETTILAETAGDAIASRDCSYYVYRWELTPRTCKAYDKRYRGDIPQSIPGEDLLQQIALDLFRENMWQAHAPPPSSASPTFAELEDWFKFLTSVNRVEEAHMVMEMTERMLRHCREILAEESADKQQQAIRTRGSVHEPVEDQVMRIVEAHNEHRRGRDSSACEIPHTAGDIKTTVDQIAAATDDKKVLSTHDEDPLPTTSEVPAPIAAPTPLAKVQKSEASRMSLSNTRSLQTSAEGRKELDRLKTTASLFAMQFTKEEASYVSQHAARLLRAIVPCYTGRGLILAAPEDLDPLSRETLNIYAPPPSSADKDILLSSPYFSTLIKQRRDAKVQLQKRRHAYLEMASPELREGELGRYIDEKWCKEQEVPREYRLQHALRREANMKAVIDYVVAHRKLDVYQVSRDLLLWEMEYDAVQMRRHEEEGSDDSGLDEDLLTPDAIQRALLIQQQNSYNNGAQVEEVDTVQPLRNSGSQASEAPKVKPKLTRPNSVISDALGIVQRLPTDDRSEEQLIEEVPTNEEEIHSVDVRSYALPKPTMVRLDTDLTTSHETLARYHTWLTDLPPSRASHEAANKKGHFRRRSIEVAKDLGPNLAAKVSNASSRSMDNLLTSLNHKTDVDTGNERNPKSPTFKEVLPMTRRRSVMKVFSSRQTSYVYKEDFAPVENIAPTTPSAKITSPSPSAPKQSRARAFSDTEYTVMQIEGVSRPQTAQERNIQLHMEVEAAEKRMYDLLPRREKMKLKMKKAGKRMVHKIQDAADLAMGRR